MRRKIIEIGNSQGVIIPKDRLGSKTVGEWFEFDFGSDNYTMKTKDISIVPGYSKLEDKLNKIEEQLIIMSSKIDSIYSQIFNQYSYNLVITFIQSLVRNNLPNKYPNGVYKMNNPTIV